ncbi:MAG: hypothetical protein MR361_02145 [Clostridiales bacterium]|nr:hypothetical protein [Clostridiales bacterium]MDD6293279.1 hypothetical protein [Eubacteriales bacterium]
MTVKLFKMSYRNLLIFLLCMAAGFFMGLTIQLVNGESDSQQISTIMTILITCFFEIFFTPMGMANDFKIYIQMGGTRKTFYIAELVFEIVKYLILAGFSAISYIVQKQIYNKSGKESCLINEQADKYINIGSVLLLICFVTALMMLLSTLAVRYKGKVYIIIWIVYLVVCMIPVQLHNLDENDNDSMTARFALWIKNKAWFSNLKDMIFNPDMTQVYLAAGSLTVLCLVISYLIIARKDY